MTSIDQALVRRLIASQFPQWAELRVRPVALDGWDNRTFRLGEALSVRLPSAAHYALQVEKEQRYLPRLAPHLPLPIPTPVAMGRPDADYQWPWSVYRWIDGEPATVGHVDDMEAFAATLADFLNALRRVDGQNGPPPGAHNFHRGGSLRVYDNETRQAIAALRSRINVDAATAAWEAALSADWHGPSVWVHGDVAAGNLLLREGTLSAVIDFGSSAVGDPACDLSIAWTFFSGKGRAMFQRLVDADDAMWRRGLGWTLWKALIVCAGLLYESKQNRVVQDAWRVLGDVLTEWTAGLV